MNNFTKSIVYSGVVLAAGLVAIFAIYNNMGATGSSMANLEPAAGETSMMVSEEEAMPGYETMAESMNEMSAEAGDMAHDAMEATEDAAHDAMEATEDAAHDAMEAVEETTEDAVEAAEEMAEDTMDAVEDMTTEETPAEEATEAVEETTEEAGDAIEDAADAVEEHADEATH